MQSVAFKVLFPLSLLVVSTAAASMDAGGGGGSSMGGMGGIPVSCEGCEKAVKDANYDSANSIIDAIRAQTEGLVNAMDYVMRVEQGIVNARAKAEHKLSNAYQMQPELGAKPRAACGQFGAASARAMLASKIPQLQGAYSNQARSHLETGKRLAAGESRTAYDVKQVLEVMDNENFAGAEDLMSESAIEESQLEKLLAMLKAILMTLTPFPVSMPNEAEVERIKAHGTPAQKERLAQAVVMNERIAVGQQVFTENLAKRTRTISTRPMRYMLKDIEELTGQSVPEKISEYELDELMATYRVKSKRWFTTVVASPSEEAAKKDGLLMQAEILNQLWQLNREIRQLNRLTAHDSVRDTAQAGLMSR